MKKRVLAIFDYEIDYANNLMDYFNRKKDFLFEARVFTNIESLQEYAKEYEIDLLLISEDINLSYIKGDNIRNIIILSEQDYAKETNEICSIYKFQSTENIIKEILVFYLNQTELMPQMGQIQSCRQAKMIGVFSPVGGNYKTTFSLALGQTLAEHRAVLYVNMEVISGFCNIEEVIQGGLSDLIYYINQRKSNFSIKLKSMVQKMGNLDYLPPVAKYSDLYEMEQSDIRELVRQMKEDSNYDVIIVDIEFVGTNTIELLKLCEKVYMPTSQCRSTKEKENSFLKILQNEEEEDLFEKLTPIEIPIDLCIAKDVYNMEHLNSGDLGLFIDGLVREYDNG